MSNEKSDNEFWDIAERFIQLANEQLENHPEGQVGSAMLYAAARFNAFVVASVADKDLADEKEDAIKYISEQFKTPYSGYDLNPLR